MPIGASEARFDLESLAGAVGAYSPDCIKVLDGNGRLIDMNDDGRSLLGIVDFDAVRGSYWPDFWSGEDRAAALAAIAAARSGEAARFEGFFTTMQGEPKWWDVVVSPMPRAADAGGLLLAISRDITVQRRADRHFRFLSDIGTILDGALDPTETLHDVAEAIVGALADVCAFDMVTDDGSVKRLAFAYRDRTARATAERLATMNPVQRASQPVAIAMRTREPVLTRSVDGPALAIATSNAEHAEIGEALGIRSFLTVPMLVRGRAIGALSLALSGPGRGYDFDESDVALAMEVARRVTAAVQTARRYERELHVATSFQAAALPRELPTPRGVTFDATYVPASDEATIGGDWYDAFELPDGRVMITIGDVMGHGLTAAVTMGAIRQTMRAVALTGADPVRVLDVADRTLRLDDRYAIATAIVAIVDVERMVLSCALAGHPLPILRRADGTVSSPFVPGGLPLGLRMAKEPISQEIALRPGDLIALVTDGILEQTRDLRAGEWNLREAMASDAVYGAERPAWALYERLCVDETSDDIAILTMRVDAEAD